MHGKGTPFLCESTPFQEYYELRKTICKDLLMGHILLFIDEKGRGVLVCLSDYTLSCFNSTKLQNFTQCSLLHYNYPVIRLHCKNR
jgi:hypothetical protein